MTLLLIAFGVFMVAAGIALVIDPEFIFTLLRANRDKFELHAAAVLARLVLGILFIYKAGVSKYPLVIEFLGWLFLLSWALSLAKPFGRVAGILAVGFGSFIIYAFI